MTYLLVAAEWTGMLPYLAQPYVEAVNRELTAGSSEWLHCASGWYIVRRRESAAELNLKLVALGGEGCRLLIVPLGERLPWMTGFLPQEVWDWIGAKQKPSAATPLTESDREAAVAEASRLLKEGST